MLERESSQPVAIKTHNTKVNSGVHVSPKTTQVMGFTATMARILIVTFSTMITFVLIDGANVGTVLASAMVGFVGSFLPSTRSIPASTLHADIFIGSFAGMCSGSIILGLNEVFAIGVMAGGVTVIIGNWLNGMGGRLGSIAFIASVFTMGEVTLW